MENFTQGFKKAIIVHMGQISVVINTLNEEANIKKAIKSVEWADEIIVCDMYSEDETAIIAKKLGAKVIFHKKAGYVEPARNFAINQAKGDWILILDADEQIPESLAKKLQEVASQSTGDIYVEIPRKNTIFGKWLKGSGWWPDYNIRFFKAGSVIWKDEIHSKPQVTGNKVTLNEEESLAIVHNHYTNISQFIERMNRYTQIQAQDLKANGAKFHWTDLIDKPTGEFLSRFFARNGYQDGIHGLSLSLLQAFSFLIVYLKLWEMEGFTQQDLKLGEVKQIVAREGKDFNYWIKFTMLSKNAFKRGIQKVTNIFS